jgi:hypothetical protein
MAAVTELSASLAGLEAPVFRLLSWVSCDTPLIIIIIIIIIIITITHLDVLLENCNFRKFE